MFIGRMNLEPRRNSSLLTPEEDRFLECSVKLCHELETYMNQSGVELIHMYHQYKLHDNHFQHVPFLYFRHAVSGKILPGLRDPFVNPSICVNKKYQREHLPYGYSLENVIFEKINLLEDFST